MKCLNCGYENSENNKYCIKCGNKLEANKEFNADTITFVGETNIVEEKPEVKTSSRAFVLGIIALVLANIIPFTSYIFYVIIIALGILALIFGIIDSKRKKCAKNILGIVFGALSISSGIGMILIRIFLGSYLDEIMNEFNDIFTEFAGNEEQLMVFIRSVFLK